VLYLKPFLTAKIVGSEKVQVGHSGKFKILVYGNVDTTLSFLDDLKLGISDKPEKRLTYYKSRMFNADQVAQIEKVLNRLESNDLVSDTFLDKKDVNSRVNSFLSLLTNSPIQLRTKLESKTIVILGCGGLGTSVIPSLLNLGVKNYILIDDDIIEESNVTRSPIFSLNDIGNYKIDCIENWISNNVRDYSVIKHKARITEETLTEIDISNSDLIICTADDDDGLMKSRIDGEIYSTGLPYLYSGYWENIAIVGPILNKEITPCYKCSSSSLTREGQWTPDMDDVCTPSSLLVNSLLSSHISLEIIRYFLADKKAYKPHFYAYDLISNIYDTLPIDSSSRCEKCQGEIVNEG